MEIAVSCQGALWSRKIPCRKLQQYTLDHVTALSKSTFHHNHIGICNTLRCRRLSYFIPRISLVLQQTQNQRLNEFPRLQVIFLCVDWNDRFVGNKLYFETRKEPSVASVYPSPVLGDPKNRTPYTIYSID
jgi:hypothetical protein